MIAKYRKTAKHSLQTIFFFFFIGVLALAILIFLFTSNLKLSERKTELDSQILSLDKELQILERENQELKAGISQISQDSYLEKKAREQFNLKKPGETVVAFVKEDDKKEEEEKKENFWQRLLRKLKFWSGECRIMAIMQPSQGWDEGSIPFTRLYASIAQG